MTDDLLSLQHLFLIQAAGAEGGRPNGLTDNPLSERRQIFKTLRRIQKVRREGSDLLKVEAAELTS